MREHQEKLNASKVKVISLLSFFFGFADAFLVYVLSSYCREVFGTDNVSLFYLASFSIVLVSLLYLQTFIRKMGNIMLLFLFLVFGIFSTAFLIIFPPSLGTIFMLMLHLVFANLIWVNLDIILESFSEDGKSGRIRGLYLTVVNLGWLLAPFLSTKILDTYGFSSLFFINLVLYSVILVVALLSFHHSNWKSKAKSVTPKQIIRKVFARRDLVRIYHIACSIEFFYAVMIVYSPLYLLHMGFVWHEIGIIFSVMLLPFVLIQYPLGVLADKYFGEKEMLVFSLLIMGITTAYLPFIQSNALAVWALAMFATRIGAASADILRDSYFYKRVGKNDIDIISFFRTARPLANIASAGLTGVLLLFFPLHIIFFLIVVVLFISLLSAVTLVDNASERSLAEERITL